MTKKLAYRDVTIAFVGHLEVRDMSREPIIQLDPSTVDKLEHSSRRKCLGDRRHVHDRFWFERFTCPNVTYPDAAFVKNLVAITNRNGESRQRKSIGDASEKCPLGAIQ